MPDFGIGEAILGLGTLFGGEAAAGGAALGVGEALGAGAAGAEAGAFGTGLGAAAAGGESVAALAGPSSELLAGGAAEGGAGLTADISASGPGLTAGSNVFSQAATAAPAAGGAPIAGGDAFASVGGAGSFGGAPEANTLLNPATYGNLAGPSAGQAGQTSTFGSLLDSTVAGAKANPLQAAGIGVGAAALGYNLSQGGKTGGDEKALRSSANQLSAQGKQLASYFLSGTLPPNVQKLLDQKADAAKAARIQANAARGMPTDPNMDTALSQDLSMIDQQVAIQVATIGQQLLSQGVTEVGLSDQLLAQLISIDQKQNATTGQAIGNFAAALGGSRQPPARATA